MKYIIGNTIQYDILPYFDLQNNTQRNIIRNSKNYVEHKSCFEPEWNIYRSVDKIYNIIGYHIIFLAKLLDDK